MFIISSMSSIFHPTRNFLVLNFLFSNASNCEEILYPWDSLLLCWRYLHNYNVVYIGKKKTKIQLFCLYHFRSYIIGLKSSLLLLNSLYSSSEERAIFEQNAFCKSWSGLKMWHKSYRGLLNSKFDFLWTGLLYNLKLDLVQLCETQTISFNNFKSIPHGESFWHFILYLLIWHMGI